MLMITALNTKSIFYTDIESSNNMNTTIAIDNTNYYKNHFPDFLTTT